MWAKKKQTHLHLITRMVEFTWLSGHQYPKQQILYRYSRGNSSLFMGKLSKYYHKASNHFLCLKYNPIQKQKKHILLFMSLITRLIQFMHCLYKFWYNLIQHKDMNWSVENVCPTKYKPFPIHIMTFRRKIKTATKTHM